MLWADWIPATAQIWIVSGIIALLIFGLAKNLASSDVLVFGCALLMALFGIITPTQLFSGNVLIRKATLMLREGPFDPRFGLSGGEDADLFNALRLRGARFVWNAEAYAHEVLPAERLTQAWFLKRRRRGAQDYALQVLNGVHGRVTALTRLKLWGDTLIKLVLAVAGWALVSALRRHPAVRFDWRRKIEAQRGKLDTLRGRGRILEYQKRPPA